MKKHLTAITLCMCPMVVASQHATISLPREYVWTEGQSSPRFEDENYSVASLYVHDFDADGCDDVLVSFSDSLSVPRVVMGGRESRIGDLSLPPVRTIRHAVSRDVNGDGILDFIAFTAPHGWMERELGSAWDSDEPDFVYFSGPDGSFFSLPRETYAHTGIVGDVNGDGIVDIWPIGELDSRFRRPYLFSQDPFSLRDGRNFRRFSSSVISGSASADLNGDGLDDFVLTLGAQINQRVSNRDAEKLGAFSVAMGRAGVKINDLDWKIYSATWISDGDWSEYLTSLEGTDSKPYTAPSNINLIDINGDGHLDILVGFYVLAGSWRSAGFQIWENQGNGEFLEKTDTYVPNQDGHRNMQDTITFIISAAMADVNRDGYDDLVVASYDSDSWAGQGESISVYLNRQGTFQPQGQNSNLSRYSSLTVGDFNCNGKLDLVGLGATTPTTISLGFFLQ